MVIFITHFVHTDKGLTLKIRHGEVLFMMVENEDNVFYLKRFFLRTKVNFCYQLVTFNVYGDRALLTVKMILEMP